MLRHRSYVLLFCALSALFPAIAGEPSGTFSLFRVNQGVIKDDGRFGITVSSSLSLSNMIGRKLGVLGYIYDANSKKIICQGTYNDMYHVDKIRSQNLPFVSVFIPTGKMDNGHYRIAMTVYDYSDGSPKKILTDSFPFSPDAFSDDIDVKWELPSASNPTVTVSIKSKEPLSHIWLDKEMIKLNGQQTANVSRVINKQGTHDIELTVFTKSGQWVKQQRTVFFGLPVIVENVRLVPYAYGGSFHKISYDCRSAMPIGRRYGLRGKIYEVKKQYDGTEKMELAGQSLFYFKVQERDVDHVSDGQILIPSEYLKLDQSKDYVTSVVPYMYDDENWLNILEGAFSCRDTCSDRPVTPVFDNDNNGVKFDWIMCPNETQSDMAQIKIGLKSPSKLQSVDFTVNGQKIRGVKVVKNDGYDMILSETVALAEGANEVIVTAGNAKGKRSSSKGIVRKTQSPSVKSTSRQAALIIGNAEYPGNELYNTTNDATDLSAKLKSLGFDVMKLENGSKFQTEKVIEQFAAKSALMKVSFFFFAGHAMQLDGVNYLIPVDAKISSLSDVKTHCISLDDVINRLDASGCELKILSLDACRNNPFVGKNMASQGLSRLNTPAAIGTLVSFATAPGSVASDGTSRNSPYTSALLKVLDVPRLTIDQVFNRVGSQVVAETNKQQQPWITKTVINDEFIFNKK